MGIALIMHILSLLPSQAGMDANLAVMTIGATTGVTYGTERMSRSKGGIGGRIITTASGAGLIVSNICDAIMKIPTVPNFTPINFRK